MKHIKSYKLFEPIEEAIGVSPSISSVHLRGIVEVSDSLQEIFDKYNIKFLNDYPGHDYRDPYWRFVSDYNPKQDWVEKKIVVRNIFPFFVSLSKDIEDMKETIYLRSNQMIDIEYNQKNSSAPCITISLDMENYYKNI